MISTLRCVARRALYVGCAAAAGCYSYAPARLESVQAGAPVRVRITLTEAVRLEPMRLTDDRYVQGLLVQRTTAELLIDTRVGQTDRQRGTRALTQRINIAVSEIQDVELRRRDNLKTAVAIGAVGVGAGIGIAAALGAGRGGNENPGDGEPEMRPRPIGFRLQLPLSFFTRHTP